MKKIMFNDQYGLTEAVLDGRKTQTRRILNPTMLFERLDTYEGWTKESIADWKESCKDRLYKAEGEKLKEMLNYALEHSPYKVGENVAIAQRYIDLADNDEFYRLCGIHGMPLECIKYEKGCYNKMFVKADLMPHRIRITNIRVERLQDISTDDCMKEGIFCCHMTWFHDVFSYDATNDSKRKKWWYDTPIEAYKMLSCKLKLHWNSNPLVFVYDFKLVK